MRKKIATTALLLAWLCANGALLDVVQVFAWGKMFSGYAKTMSVTSALRETFDPTKPCEMCVGVAAAKEDLEQKKFPVSTDRDPNKVVLAFHSPAPLVLFNVAEMWPDGIARRAPNRNEPVPLPPPRV